MPVYQYACTECGEQLEVHQSFTDTSLTECPSCEGRLRKVLNAVGVVFKGSGFYRNDSRAAAKAESGTATAGKDATGSAKKGEATSTSDGSSTSEGSSKSDGSSKSGGSSKSDASKKESTPASTGSAGGSKPAPAAAR